MLSAVTAEECRQGAATVKLKMLDPGEGFAPFNEPRLVREGKLLKDSEC